MVFRSQDYSAVLYCLRQLFEKVEVFKPDASRLTSAEIYMIGLRYKAPAKIDPRLLDTKHLFQGAEPQKVINILRGRKQKRHRDGYEDGVTLVRKVRSAADFVWSDKPDDVLGSATSLLFDDPSSLLVKEHDSTTEEIITLCEDIGVLGTQDVKQLLKWGRNIRKALSLTKKSDAAFVAVNANEPVEKGEPNDDENLLDQMKELTYEAERKKKHEKKILARRQAKNKEWKATGMQIDALQDGYDDNDLFSLASIKGKEDLTTVDTTEDADFGQLASSDDDADNEEDERSGSRDLDSEEERERSDKQIENILDEEYERFLALRNGTTKRRRQTMKGFSDTLTVDNDDGDDIEAVEPDVDMERDHGDQITNPLVLLIDNKRKPTQEEMKQRWFSNDIFVEALEEGDLGNNSSNYRQKNVQRRNFSLTRKSSQSTGNHSDGLKYLIDRPTKNDDDLEVVPAPGAVSSESSSSDSYSEDNDTDTKADMRVLGKKILGSKRKRQEIEDMAYYKHMSDDHHLPKWLCADLEKCNAPRRFITEEREAEKASNKEINTRTVKKVAEAKARKKRAALRNLEKIRKRANSIADQADLPERSKSRMIDQLYSKATPRKQRKEFVVAKKGVQVRPGKGKVLVDRRMKKDARHHGISRQTKKGKGKSTAKMGYTYKGDKGEKYGMANYSLWK